MQILVRYDDTTYKGLHKTIRITIPKSWYPCPTKNILKQFVKTYNTMHSVKLNVKDAYLAYLRVDKNDGSEYYHPIPLNATIESRIKDRRMVYVRHCSPTSPLPVVQEGNTINSSTIVPIENKDIPNNLQREHNEEDGNEGSDVNQEKVRNNAIENVDQSVDGGRTTAVDHNSDIILPASNCDVDLDSSLAHSEPSFETKYNQVKSEEARNYNDTLHINNVTQSDTKDSATDVVTEAFTNALCDNTCESRLNQTITDTGGHETSIGSNAIDINSSGLRSSKEILSEETKNQLQNDTFSTAEQVEVLTDKAIYVGFGDAKTENATYPASHSDSSVHGGELKENTLLHTCFLPNAARGVKFDAEVKDDTSQVDCDQKSFTQEHVTTKVHDEKLKAEELLKTESEQKIDELFKSDSVVPNEDTNNSFDATVGEAKTDAINENVGQADGNNVNSFIKDVSKNIHGEDDIVNELKKTVSDQELNKLLTAEHLQPIVLEDDVYDDVLIDADKRDAAKDSTLEADSNTKSFSNKAVSINAHGEESEVKENDCLMGTTEKKEHKSSMPSCLEFCTFGSTAPFVMEACTYPKNIVERSEIYNRTRDFHESISKMVVSKEHEPPLGTAINGDGEQKEHVLSTFMNMFLQYLKPRSMLSNGSDWSDEETTPILVEEVLLQKPTPSLTQPVFDGSTLIKEKLDPDGIVASSVSLRNAQNNDIGKFIVITDPDAEKYDHESHNVNDAPVVDAKVTIDVPDQDANTIDISYLTESTKDATYVDVVSNAEGDVVDEIKKAELMETKEPTLDETVAQQQQSLPAVTVDNVFVFEKHYCITNDVTEIEVSSARNEVQLSNVDPVQTVCNDKVPTVTSDVVDAGVDEPQLSNTDIVQKEYTDQVPTATSEVLGDVVEEPVVPLKQPDDESNEPATESKEENLTTTDQTFNNDAIQEDILVYEKLYRITNDISNTEIEYIESEKNESADTDSVEEERNDESNYDLANCNSLCRDDNEQLQLEEKHNSNEAAALKKKKPRSILLYQFRKFTQSVGLRRRSRRDGGGCDDNVPVQELNFDVESTMRNNDSAGGVDPAKNTNVEMKDGAAVIAE